MAKYLGYLEKNNITLYLVGKGYIFNIVSAKCNHKSDGPEPENFRDLDLLVETISTRPNGKMEIWTKNSKNVCYTLICKDGECNIEPSIR